MRKASRSTAGRLPAFVGLAVALGLLTMSVPAATAASGATFSGTASLHIVGTTDSGAIVQMSMADVPYNVAITPSSLTLVAMGMTMGGPLASGKIAISEASAHGGGTLGGASASQMAFAVSSNGGQFECLMAGFTAGFSLEVGGMTLTIIQMDVHGAVTPGSYAATG